MTEAEWLACTDPHAMLNFLRGKASDRKLRLFAVACCHRVGAFVKDERFGTAVRAAEGFADGVVTYEEMSEVRNAALPACVKLHDAEAAAAAGRHQCSGHRIPEEIVSSAFMGFV